MQNADIAHSAATADLWTFAGPRGQSIATVFNWLLPYVSGDKQWPYPQNSEAPSWVGLFWTLRRASVALANSTFERVACRLAKERVYDADGAVRRVGVPRWPNSEQPRSSAPLSNEIGDNYGTSPGDLLNPPRYVVNC